jgi:FixJ family two-component response regulator
VIRTDRYSSSIFQSIKRALDDIYCLEDGGADPVRNEKQEADVEDQSIVYVIDDDASMREALKSLFGSVGLRVEAFGAAPEFFGKKLPDAAICLVVDVRLPGLSGLDFQAELSKANIDVPIIFITGHGDIAMTVKAMKAGAVEFFPKPFRDQDLLDAVKLALEKDEARRKSRKTSAVVRSLFESLTPREQEVIRLVTAGLMNKQVAAEMGVSEITVKVHRGNVMRKMKAHSLADLVRMADMLGIRRNTA